MTNYHDLTLLAILISFLAFSIPSYKVSEMKAEYFPPNEDVILQNEAPTDLYVLVTGLMVRINFNFLILFCLCG